jgi:hypothetical protein
MNKLSLIVCTHNDISIIQKFLEHYMKDVDIVLR